jgi:hypothetical protein
VLPAEWGEVGEQCIRNDVPAEARSFQPATEINCVPQRDGSGDQGETARAVLLSLGSAIVKPSKPMEADCPSQGCKIACNNDPTPKAAYIVSDLLRPFFIRVGKNADLA